MTAKSKYIEDILNNRGGAVTSKIVAADISSYSLRRTKAQTEVIDAFINCLRSALNRTLLAHAAAASAQGLNLNADVLTIPTGDGAIVVFPSDGFRDIHLYFARELLGAVYAHNKALGSCSEFDRDGWCNCHGKFKIRAGVNQGSIVFFRDFNRAYNVAGRKLNTAVRIADASDPMQIVFESEAYQQLIDLSDDPNLSKQFKGHSRLQTKRGETVAVHQYVAGGDEFLNREPPRNLEQVLQDTSDLAQRRLVREQQSERFDSVKSVNIPRRKRNSELVGVRIRFCPRDITGFKKWKIGIEFKSESANRILQFHAGWHDGQTLWTLYEHPNQKHPKNFPAEIRNNKDAEIEVNVTMDKGWVQCIGTDSSGTRQFQGVKLANTEWTLVVISGWADGERYHVDADVETVWLVSKP